MAFMKSYIAMGMRVTYEVFDLNCSATIELNNLVGGVECAPAIDVGCSTRLFQSTREGISESKIPHKLGSIRGFPWCNLQSIFADVRPPDIVQRATTW